MEEVFYIVATQRNKSKKVFQMVEWFRVIKFVEGLMKDGYEHITIEGEKVRYTIYEKINCSCLIYHPEKKKFCKTCISNPEYRKLPK